MEESVSLDSLLINWQRQMNGAGCYGDVMIIMIIYNSHERVLIYTGDIHHVYPGHLVI